LVLLEAAGDELVGLGDLLVEGQYLLGEDPHQVGGDPLTPQRGVLALGCPDSRGREPVGAAHLPPA
jgi:hypothetical protein